MNADLSIAARNLLLSRALSNKPTPPPIREAKPRTFGCRRIPEYRNQRRLPPCFFQLISYALVIVTHFLPWQYYYSCALPLPFCSALCSCPPPHNSVLPSPHTSASARTPPRYLVTPPLPLPPGPLPRSLFPRRSPLLREVSPQLARVWVPEAAAALLSPWESSPKSIALRAVALL